MNRIERLKYFKTRCKLVSEWLLGEKGYPLYELKNHPFVASPCWDEFTDIVNYGLVDLMEVNGEKGNKS